MKAGRKPNEIPREQIKHWMRIDLLAELRLWLMDPVSGKTKKGELTKYFENLVEKDLTERRRNAQTATAEKLREGAQLQDREGGRGGRLGDRQAESRADNVVQPLGEPKPSDSADQQVPPGTSVESTDSKVEGEGKGDVDKVG